MTGNLTERKMQNEMKLASEVVRSREKTPNPYQLRKKDPIAFS
jgi:hypothetical protein